jgi:hypothetical protein
MRVSGEQIILVDPTPHTGGSYPIDFNRCSNASEILGLGASSLRERVGNQKANFLFRLDSIISSWNQD